MAQRLAFCREALIISTLPLKQSMTNSSRFILALIALCWLVLTPCPAQTVFYGPSRYLDFNGTKSGAGTNYSPFADLLFSYFYLETFEAGVYATPGMTNSGGEIQPPGIYADSVDGDDGVINGSGSMGRSMHIITNTVMFTFNTNVLGSWPTHVGVVWTDAGYRADTRYFGHVLFEAFGPDTNSLGVIGPVAVGDGFDGGQTAEDRFFGVSDSRGISAISLSMTNCTDWELDHVQYGREAVAVGQTNAFIRIATTNSAVMQVSWPSQTDTLYQVLWTPALSSSSNVWRPLGSWELGVDTNANRNVGGGIAGTGSTNVVTDPAASNSQKFYRVIQIQ